jgi:hypothetical protein
MLPTSSRLKSMPSKHLLAAYMDGGSTLLCNVGKILTGYTASNSERQYSSFSYLEQLIYNLETYQANLMPRQNFISFINTKMVYA